MSTLGSRIKSIRGNETQEAFSTRIGVSKGSLGGYERGENSPSADAILKICSGANISVEWLMTGRGPMRPRELMTLASAPLSEVLLTPASVSPPDMPLSEAAEPPHCPRCTKLEAKLEKVESQRDNLVDENRQLWKENATLREELARLQERANAPGAAAFHVGAGSVA